ncbi:MarR family winged helix-turn-helix transcriptional regulator [Henriciella aquimarina]|uniref:MarR family winged helix-turn-helix transcriptional regulator n=1 Tax=Henriciella aquimarina TaxID=545261 RepID=UPI0013019E1D|nr:MarR family winged helix-turn-helix transcriptional regulator [Henriciella aquimarina]
MSTMSAARDHRLYHKLQLAAHRLQKAADHIVFAEAPLTTAQAAVLTIVRGQGEASQKWVAEKLGLHESAVTTMVSRLGKLGFIERCRAETDRRVWLLSVTEDGQRALEAVGPSFARLNRQIEAELSDEEVEQLAGMLDRLNRRFAG